MTSINALKAFALVQGNPRSPYALLFIKGKTGAIEVNQPYQGTNAHIKTTYYELFNYGNSSVVLRGMIMIWSGSKDHIPVGWALCDGHNGTPDLRGRFVLGYGTGGDLKDNGLTERGLNNKGGLEEVKLGIDHLPNHNHAATATTTSKGFKQDHNHWKRGVPGGSYLGYSENVTIRVDVKSEGQGKAHENMPPFYVLAYIMNL